MYPKQIIGGLLSLLVLNNTTGQPFIINVSEKLAIDYTRVLIIMHLVASYYQKTLLDQEFSTFMFKYQSRYKYFIQSNSKYKYKSKYSTCSA